MIITLNNAKKLFVHLLFLLFVFVYILFAENNADNWSYKLTVISLILIFLQAWTLISLKYKLYSFQFVFFILSYLFYFGRIWLNCFRLDDEIFWVLHKLYTDEVLLTSGLYLIISLELVFISMIIFANRKDTINDSINTSLNESNKKALFSTGIVLLIIGIPCRIFTDVYSIITTAISSSINTIASPTGILDDLAFLLVPGLLCVFESRKHMFKYIFPIVILYFIIIMSMTGDRRYYVSALLSMFLYYFSTAKNSKKKKNPIVTVTIGLFVVIFLNFIEVLRDVRLGGLGSFSDFIKQYGIKVLRVDNLLWNLFAEFGISFFSVASVVSYIPTKFPFQVGKSFLYSIPSILPIGPVFGDLFDSASPSSMINKLSGLPVGATIFGDFYANFSYGGFIAAFVMGLILKNIFRDNPYNLSGIKKVVYFTSLYILINLIRCCFFEIVRPLVWCTAILFLIYRIFGGRTHEDTTSWSD